jgi:hypothetical protein
VEAKKKMVAAKFGGSFRMGSGVFWRNPLNFFLTLSGKRGNQHKKGYQKTHGKDSWMLRKRRGMNSLLWQDEG